MLFRTLWLDVQYVLEAHGWKLLGTRMGGAAPSPTDSCGCQWWVHPVFALLFFNFCMEFVVLGAGIPRVHDDRVDVRACVGVERVHPTRVAVLQRAAALVRDKQQQEFQAKSMEVKRKKR
uniref:Uncharacterized protein n=1 Tax=Hyaloperonospora arabidopsidis (strain Emoy2) TaxID=559515 RepID=M4B688_HYAAE